jgi:HK97 family phage major capsid protein
MNIHYAKVLNQADKSGKNIVKMSLEKNSLSDEGNGKIVFPNRLVITDDSEQFNGTKYDIKSMTIEDFSNKLTADHLDGIQSVLGKVMGLQKIGNTVTISGIQFAVNENALALYAYNMIKAGFLTDFSIETMGPWPDPDGVYYNSNLVGLSLVVYGNNKSAAINQIALNSVEEAKKNNLDTSLVEKNYICYDENQAIAETHKKQENEMFKYVKNSRGFAVLLKYKNSQGEETEVTVNPGKGIEVPEAEAPAVEKQITDAQEPKVEAPAAPAPTAPVAGADVAEVVKQAMAPFMKQLNDLEQRQFDNSATEPQFVAAKPKADTVPTASAKELNSLGYKEIHGLQINAAWDFLKGGSQIAGNKLRTMNMYNLEKLQQAGKVSNAVTIADFGNFVISPELLTEIEGHRSDFNPLISRLNIKDTLSLQMAWLKRNGDVDMQEVAFCDDGANGNLKPITEYDADFNISNLSEVAGVTPVCNAATRFLAVDLLGDVAEGYRTDFDRKRAQLFVARLQQAVNSTGNTSVYGTTTALAALQSFIGLASSMQEEIMGGVYILSNKSYWQLMSQQLAAGINTDSGFQLFTKGDMGPLLLGSPYITVPNELLPTLNTAETRSFVVDGQTVTINQAVFYVDLSTYAGRTSGGLSYDLSTEASYEVNSVVKSAFQRNELVLRGSFFRGGAVKDEDKVVGLGSRGVS